MSRGALAADDRTRREGGLYGVVGVAVEDGGPGGRVDVAFVFAFCDEATLCHDAAEFADGPEVAAFGADTSVVPVDDDAAEAFAVDDAFGGFFEVEDFVFDEGGAARAVSVAGCAAVVFAGACGFVLSVAGPLFRLGGFHDGVCVDDRADEPVVDVGGVDGFAAYKLDADAEGGGVSHEDGVFDVVAPEALLFVGDDDVDVVVCDAGDELVVGRPVEFL